MHRPGTRLRSVGVSLLVLLLAAAALLYGLSERIIRRTYAAPLVSVEVPTDSGAIAEGGRIALIHGCRGCHGPDGSGKVWDDDFAFGYLAAPSLIAAARSYTDAELARIIRRGVRPDGRSVWAMPSEMFAPLTDADVGLILAWLRSRPPAPGVARRFRPGPLARWEILRGEYLPAAVLVAVTDSLTAAGVFPQDDEPQARGAYLARTACPECHNLTLEGYPGDTPDLRIAAGYTPAQFAHFLATGEALGGRELALMSLMARNRFSHFTDEEEAQLHGYLLARAGVAQAQGAAGL